MSLPIDQRSRRSAGQGREGLASASSDCVDNILHLRFGPMASGIASRRGFAPIPYGKDDFVGLASLKSPPLLISLGSILVAFQLPRLGAQSLPSSRMVFAVTRLYWVRSLST